MNFLSQFLVLLIFFECFPSVEPATLGITTDKEALLSFMSSLSYDPHNPLSTWTQTTSPCNWTGVICDKMGSRVMGLDLSGLQLSGPISRYIGNLSFLQSLNLQNNRFIGPIPQEITKLFRLRVLNMSSNQIEGVLPPNISQWKELETLDMMENRITGKLPEELSKLTRLKVLKLGKNHFYGEIPLSLANVSSLTTLNFGTNTLGGVIPSEFGRLRNLTELDITINNITGTIPPPIYNLTSLVNLAVASNNLWGEIPYDVGEKLPNLLIFNFCFNKFTGRIPGSLHNLTRIRVIRMADNFLEGNVPPGLGNLPFLQMYNIGFNRIVSSGDDGLSFITSLTNSSWLSFLAIGGNQLEGQIPESIGNLSKVLSKLSMAGNRIYGDIPVSIGHLTSLTLLNLRSNLISGEIPAQIGELKELQMLGLAKNIISGAIPKSLGNLRKLNSVDLSGNSLLGFIPSSFGEFQSLLSMDLSNNKLNGSIPKECLNLPSLSIVLNLSNNFLSGPLPGEIGSLENIVTIDLSNNLLSSQIPNSIKGCISLEKLLLANNRFFGPIPLELAEIRGLETLDLSSNQLTGSIPGDLQNLLALKYLNLSFNNLEGVVPRDGVFRDSSNVHLEGNKKLCQDLTCLNNGSDAQGKRVAKIVLVTVVPAILILCLVVCLLLHLRKSKAQVTEASEVLRQKGQHQMISYKELRQATGTFSDDILIGRGSFGSVYRGYLTEGIFVAVKVLDTHITGSWKSFIAECEALRNVRHRNLVRLITSCSSIDFKNMEFLALVYEYMSNGSLEDWIRGKKRKANGEPLNVLERLNVAIDIASSLYYLHNDCAVPIVHCDIKPSNILFDEEMTAKVGDFGLARLLMEKGEARTSISSTHVLKGSIGYIPPEYGLGEKPSIAGDAYSFGVTLLELFTGRSPIHESFTAELNLPTWVQSAFPENLVQVIDSELLEFYKNVCNEGQSITSPEREYDCLTKIIEIGLSCTTDSPDRRMSIRLALDGLKTATRILLKPTMRMKI